MVDAGGAPSRPLLDLTAGEVRRAGDGWHAVLRIGAVDHRVWSKEPPVLGASYAAELPFDGDLEARAYAARRLWRAMNGRAPGPAFYQLSKQRRERLSAAIRALDAHGAGVSYRVIAEALFGKRRIPDRAWKTHDLRNRTIRLVQGGLALMRGGYRKLLRPGRRDQ
ncbi:DUF2285 domain-containing protein [Bradyrhizobium sp. RD5-C2]|uniref:DUF2285 domain-containing protein n=1 Tax=Bradyrhizobium sp. RD5-C2 TaxID=244562 RepID=UPI001CC68569|nr:DUF2285 domain-containing protein [Bradyrhizobium sp. RD5-C2]GIQ75477.1 hypothetical protein BraRD5C2_39180 [Bradyrhizobium sp. RD5-C2]